MALASKISATELTGQVVDRFQDKHIAAILINAPGVTYTPGTTDDATFLANEIAMTDGVGAGGYRRQIFNYSVSDVATYSDGGVGLAQKATVFAHDGSATAIDFTHAALIWSTGNILTTTSTATVPTAGVDGTYVALPITRVNGAGIGGTANLTITNSGASQSDYVVTVTNGGYGYAAGDFFEITEAALTAAGAVTTGAGDLRVEIVTVNTDTNAGNLITCAKTTNPASLISGYEAAFYWNLKQYGYYESLLAV